MRKFFAALALLLPVVSHAWWSDDWNFRKEITLDLSAAGANIPGSVNDVPVLIRLHIGNFGYFADTKPDGADFRVLAGDDKTPLKFHIERFDAANQMAFIWVRVPKLAGGTASEKIFLYYGNAKAPMASDAAGTYDANQVLVYHFTGPDATIVDATAFANKPSKSTAVLTPASLIGGGAKFSGAESISIPASASLRLSPKQGFTVSSWIKLDEPQNDSYVYALEDQGSAFMLGVSGRSVIARVLKNGSAIATAQSTDLLVVSQWHHVTAVYKTGKLFLYVDGVEIVSTPAEIEEIAGTSTLGASSTGGHAFVGELDEVQVSNTARAPEWVTASTRAQGQETPLLVFGGDVQREGQKVSYFAITMRNVTPDGWVVIIILAVMFVIAMLIIVSKALYLGKVKKANGTFLREFSKLRGDPTALDQGETNDGDALDESPFMPHMKDGENRFRMSTIYRLYHHGVQEMTGRVHARSVGSAAVRGRGVNTLNTQTMNAIRAAMDASSVRMSQKLGSQMVLLTIAISGGPFLGLLGTVVGVMITFAAIAASGDVNVNSIAPGIAAALAATVAGLAVAIPALFGYNWLNTQIKEINADMRVFVDEFVTRVAEEYS